MTRDVEQERARLGEQFLGFLRELPSKQTRLHILTDSDADGLPAAAILVRLCSGHLGGAAEDGVGVESRSDRETA